MSASDSLIACYIDTERLHNECNYPKSPICVFNENLNIRNVQTQDGRKAFLYLDSMKFVEIRLGTTSCNPNSREKRTGLKP